MQSESMQSESMQSEPMQSEPMQSEPMQSEPMPNATPLKKQKKEVKMIMPTKDNYSILLSFNYTIKQLKEIASHYKIKLNSTLVKADIVNKIYNYFKHYDNAVIIQRTWRRYLWRQYNKLRGPARFNRRLCVNETDFFTMDEVKDIPYLQFFSFQDTDAMIYGFDMLSIYSLFQKSYDPKTLNPYNRNILSKNIKKNVLKLIWFSRLFKEEIVVTENTSDTVEMQTINGRSITLFHDIDILGNYTNANWFLSLGQSAVVRFIMELNDIWAYRANLSEIVKNEICPNHRGLFRMLYMLDIRQEGLPIVQDIALTIMERLTRDGINRDSRCLGANFVLCALTLVSNDAANSLPWLFHSVL
jgi:hypothetical protein